MKGSKSIKKVDTDEKKLKKRSERFFDMIKNNLFYKIFYIILLFVSLGIIRTINVSGHGFTGFGYSTFTKIATLITVFVSVIYVFLFKNVDKDKKISLEKIFLLVVIPIGIMYMILMPIGTAPDEARHIFRSYEVSLGHLTSDINEEGVGGRELPTRLTEIIFDYENDTYSSWVDRVQTEDLGTEKQFIPFPNMSLYSFLCYLVQALGIAITRVFTSNLLLQIYGGRILNFVAIIYIMYFSLKKIPFKHLTFLIMACLPMVFQETASLSADGITIASATLLVSYILYLIYEKKDQLNRTDYIILIGSSLMLAMSKIVYLPLVLLLYGIPKERFKSKKDKIIKTTAIIGIISIINFAWLIYASRYLMEFNINVNSKEQLKFILFHPMRYMIIIINTLRQMDYIIYDYPMQLTGTWLGWLDIRLSSLFQLPLLMLLTFSTICENYKKVEIDNKFKILVLFVVLVTIALIFTSIYIQWNSVENWAVEGIQGRYFIPLLLLIAILCYNHFVVIEKKMPYRYILLFMVFVNIHALVSILNAFIW